MGTYAEEVEKAEQCLAAAQAALEAVKRRGCHDDGMLRVSPVVNPGNGTPILKISILVDPPEWATVARGRADVIRLRDWLTNWINENPA